MRKETGMKIAYIILAHNKPEQLIRLINRLNEEDITFIIHYDKNSPDSEFGELKDFFSNYNNIYFSERIKCYWGGINLVRATLGCLSLLQKENIQYDYASLLSGQDYPLFSNSKIKEFFYQNKGKQFMQYFKPINVWKNEDRIRYYYFNNYNIRGNSFKKFVFSNFNRIIKKLNIRRYYYPFEEFYGGSQWWSLSKDCINYILDYTRQNGKAVSFFKYVFIPDEIFFQTIILNSDFKELVVNNHLRYIDWSSDPAPKVLGKEDLNLLINSNKLFARKFDCNKDSEVLDLIDEICEGKKLKI
ncbi:beta-1,6-N-acetylglucosaminyltransferase [Alkalihalobacterium chitinilyticum]|uniref:Peptide O-xylosyltransferase n=1 Tax=Alkalihalobacterium chitinilyticum TaxID=2980103 RepID=A0ABT5VEB0_9BACI|nr:beta-1,6-N-acetylglucosaminyltransferase [Alkalihalobacterium chitinilyticum]MDE5413800.1 beta-1,6-N-acetylglucosaminyltransferase [Alkalihalobacterium chitinilyticum]